ncbi:MAG: bifunctional [glutamine synthetase] adenylyltransferase/[glutamine synthetase]-adenylyl-L-tyrosine phosphorylase [Pseudomonadota bacterium]
MEELYQGFRAAAWPRPADPASVERELGRWREAAKALDTPGRRFARRLAAARAGQALLGAVFGNSPYLSDALVKEIGFATELLSRGPDLAFAGLVRDGGPAPGVDAATLMTRLRILKRRAALVVGLADLASLWPLERVTGALSDVAELALEAALGHLLAEAARGGALRLAAGEASARNAGLAVIGMGKLGARELNFSSDIDIIVVYDEEKIATDDPEALQKTFIRLTRNLVRILEERGPEGYVFRTDLRLRPDPASTPLAISMLAAETYYESLGQNWERAAMIKARPVAGDRPAGAAFLDRLRPYVWRKHLDFAALQDIHSIKRQIDAHRGGAGVRLGGHNIKLGRGGIREIEFFAQTLQLIWGGRDPSLRSPATCLALEALAKAGRVEPGVADAAIRAYRFLRRVEHRLQMIDDKQTHTLPPDGPRLEALATFLGYSDAKQFGAALLAELALVERHYARLFEGAPTLAGPGNLVFTGTEDDPATLDTLAAMGFRDAHLVAATIRGWHHGRIRAMRSVRARELLTELKPTLLAALSRTPHPDEAFVRFDQFLGRLPAGVQIFSLFHANPGLLDVLAEILGGAPRLADALSIHPHLLESVLTPGFFDPPPDLAGLGADLAHALDQARDFEDVLDSSRRWKREREFQVGVQLLRGLLAPERAGESLAEVGECVVAALQPAVEAEFARRHGRVPGGSLAVVALGKFGAREVTVTSDLDLIFLYDVPASVEASDGDKPLPASLYYGRLAGRLINALTAPTAAGRLYEIDLRLRPSGAKGPIATSLEGFAAYNRDSAWTWEHMALTRARPLTGPPELRARIDAAIRAVLTRPRAADRLAAEVVQMRTLMAGEHQAPSPWNIKHRRGGLIDVEFIVQFLALRHADLRPDILATNTREALHRAIAAAVIDGGDGRTLLRALSLWQAVQGMLRLTVEGEFDPSTAPPGLRQALARAAGAADFAALETAIAETASAVQAIFERGLAAPDPAWRQAGA